MENKEKFTWVPFFNELFHIICEKYNKNTLVNLLYEVFADKKIFQDDSKIKPTEFDPLSFIAEFNIKRNNYNRIRYCKKVKEILNLKSNLPTDFVGIPTFNNQNAWFFGDKKESIDHFDILWKFSLEIHKNLEINENLFNLVLNIDNVRKTKLSQFLFIILPQKYYPMDSKTMSLFPDFKDEENFKCFDNFQNMVKKDEKFKNIKPYELSANVYKEYWILSAGENSSMWEDFKNNKLIAIGWDYDLGPLNNYTEKNDIQKQIQNKINTKSSKKNDSLALWQFCNEIKTNDVIYIKGKREQIIGKGIITSEYIYDENRVKYKHTRTVEWLQIGDWKITKKVAEKTLTNITKNKSLIKEIENSLKKQNKDMIKNDNAENNKDKQPLNQILYGPPGTGKTYNTIIKAMEIIKPNNHKEYLSIEEYRKLKEEFDELKQSGQIEFITFHQSYSYEEFIEGIKPNIEEWEKENSDVTYIGKNGILKDISIRSFKDLYENKVNVSFEEILNRCKEKYPDGSDINTLKNIHYGEKELIYNYGVQTRNEKIDLNQIKKIFETGKIYKRALDFNNDYNGNPGLACYYYKFFKELIIIKDELEKQKINENIKEYKLKENPKKYILIIDEINRGNISKIFGELITLIEEDKRIGNEHELKLTLPYSKEPFGIPNNLYIIGTMNTSDRSIASVDIALRRRFKFIEMMPKEDVVTNINIEENGKTFRDIFKALNEKITILLDRDHQIGHSYFLETKINDIYDLMNVWFDEILPLLNEYFYNDWEKLQALLGEASKNNDSFIVVKETKLPFYQYDIEDKVYDFIDKKNLNEENFKLALLKIIEEPKSKQKETDEQ